MSSHRRRGQEERRIACIRPYCLGLLLDVNLQLYTSWQRKYEVDVELVFVFIA